MRQSPMVPHGERNPALPVTTAPATARDVDKARLVAFPGIGHDLPTAPRPAVAREMPEPAATTSEEYPCPTSRPSSTS
jgi:hypothetical protein